MRGRSSPRSTALYTVPKLALLAVFLIIFGVGEEPVIVILAVTVFFFVWIQTMASVMAVPEGYREAAVSFGVTAAPDVPPRASCPAALPQIFVGLRIAAGVAVLTLIGVEFVFAPGIRRPRLPHQQGPPDLRAEAGLRRASSSPPSSA